MTTHHTSGAAYLPAIQRYKIGYHSDDWGQRSSTPCGIPDASGSWVRYEDHVAALAAGQAVAPAGYAAESVPAVDDKTAGHAMLWRQHCDKLDALVTYCPTCCQGFIAQKEMTRDQIIYECGKTAGRAALPAPPAMDGGDAVDAARWRMLPAFFEEYQIDAMKLYRDIDAARAAQKESKP